MRWMDSVTPNKMLSKKVMNIIIATWVALAIITWWSFPMDLIPKPLDILRALGKLWREGLAVDLGISFLLNLQAIFWSLVISLSISYLAVVPLFRPIAMLVTKLRFLSMVGLTFVFTLMLHGGHQLKVGLLVFSLTVFFVTAMTKEVLSVPQDDIDYARTLRMGNWRVVWEVIVLGKADTALEILRQNAAIGWMMLTMVEGIVRSEGGIGTLLLNQNKHFLLDSVFAIQLCIFSLGIFQDYIIGGIRILSCPYSKIAEERR